MSIEQDPCPAAIVQEGRTAYYEQLKEKELAHRAKVIEGMSWLHPFERLGRIRDVRHSDRLLEIAEKNIEQSRLDDARMIIGEAIVYAEVQAEVLLPHNPTAQNPVVVV